MNLIENSEQLYAHLIDVMKAKNHDYAGEDQKTGLENFEFSAKVAKVTVPQGILVRIMDKMARIGNVLADGAEVKNETVNDTIEDAINYLAILHFAVNNK